MVKHQKEKLYQSAREHRTNSQLRAGSTTSSSEKTRPLPFNCCALTLTPFQNPVCTPNGILFENEAIYPYLMKHKKDPVTGKPMSTRDLISLHMDKNEETGSWQCPVLCKTFSDYSKVVAIRQPQDRGRNEANVYAYEAVEELNFKAKNYMDLISGKKFSKSRDVIMLLDPNNDDLIKLRDINNFKHTKMLREDRKRKERENAGSNIKHSVTASRIMSKLTQVSNKRKKEEMNKEKKEKDKTKFKILTDDVMEGVKMTSGKCSASFTSTSMELYNINGSREATADEILDARFRAMKKMKKKGYARVVTNMGDLDIELHCDIVPRTTTNFLGLAAEGKYNGSIFHRSIRNFMIQGGKPKKKSEVSYWGKEPFRDEFDDRLTHSERGILSMANSGPNTNKCQFFITFKSCNHLDRKHSVFGKVIRGMDVLTLMENVVTDKLDEPLQKIKIRSVLVLENPAIEAEEAERIRIEARINERERQQQSRKVSALGGKKSIQKVKTLSSPTKDQGKAQDEEGGIGKYLPKNILNNLEKQDTNIQMENIQIDQPTTISRLPPPPKSSKFGDFSNW